MSEDPLMEAPTVRLGLLGYGTVARALVRLVATRREAFLRDFGVDLRFSRVASRGLRGRPEGWADGDGSGVRFTSELSEVVGAEDVDLVVELIGGVAPVRGLVRGALQRGKPVVTANKLLLAEHGDELSALATGKGVALGIEASVAGGIPILRALREGLSSDRIVSVSGILNGTSNFILSEMKRTARPFAEILREAQELGYAEADPKADVEGDDAACKLAILARLAFGIAVEPGQVAKAGIAGLLPVDFQLAERLSRVPRLIAVARRLSDGTPVLSVKPQLVSSSSPFAAVEGPSNAVEVICETGGPFLFRGAGAGGAATAVAVLSDILEIARRAGGRPLPPFGFERFEAVRPSGEVSQVMRERHYVRVSFPSNERARRGRSPAADLLRRFENAAIAVERIDSGEQAEIMAFVTVKPIDGDRLAATVAGEEPPASMSCVAMALTP